MTYTEVREKFDLTAQVVIRCLAKVCDSYKLDKKTKREFKPLGAISYDDRILKYKLSKKTVSIWTLGGRQEIPYTCGERQVELLQTQQGESDLCLVRGKWFLLATCNIETPKPQDVNGVLGVDLGVVQIASDSDGNSHSGSHVKSVRYRHKRLRTKLQGKGTKSAKRRLKKLSGKEKRFARNVNHVVSKSIVETAQRTNSTIALENLKGIRTRIRARRAQRATLHSWSFDQLQDFIQYKAQRAGVEVILVDPRNTSRQCPCCGHTEKANRKSQALFVCQACGHSANADYVGALNIRTKGEVMRPNVCKVESKSVHASFDGQAHVL
jgi:IS605 OrfB family transposase